MGISDVKIRQKIQNAVTALNDHVATRTTSRLKIAPPASAEPIMNATGDIAVCMKSRVDKLITFETYLKGNTHLQAFAASVLGSGSGSGSTTAAMRLAQSPLSK